MDIISATGGALQVGGLTQTSAVTPLTANAATTIVLSDNAASSVELSHLGQFLSTLALSPKRFVELQAAAANGTDETGTDTLFPAVTAAVQEFATAINTLSMLDVDSTRASSDTLLGQQLAQQLTTRLAQASDDDTDLARLRDIGLQVTTDDDGTQRVSVDLQVLTNALANDRDGTLTLLQQATDTLSQTGTDLAQQDDALPDLSQQTTTVIELARQNDAAELVRQNQATVDLAQSNNVGANQARQNDATADLVQQNTAAAQLVRQTTENLAQQNDTAAALARQDDVATDLIRQNNAATELARQNDAADRIQQNDAAVALARQNDAVADPAQQNDAAAALARQNDTAAVLDQQNDAAAQLARQNAAAAGVAQQNTAINDQARQNDALANLAQQSNVVANLNQQNQQNTTKTELARQNAVTVEQTRQNQAVTALQQQTQQNNAKLTRQNDATAALTRQNDAVANLAQQHHAAAESARPALDDVAQQDDALAGLAQRNDAGDANATPAGLDNTVTTAAEQRAQQSTLADMALGDLFAENQAARLSAAVTAERTLSAAEHASLLARDPAIAAAIAAYHVNETPFTRPDSRQVSTTGPAVAPVAAVTEVPPVDGIDGPAEGALRER